MLTFLYTVASFIVAISILVAIHEYGHYIVAKKLGVKILRFSIGFGKPLWSKRFGADNTEFVIARWPVGGYVKMLDRRETTVTESEMFREFTSQPVWKRFAIVFAGPLFNFLFAIFAYWIMFVVGVSGVKPVIGTVTENSLAARAGLQQGYEIVSINNAKTPIWDVALQKLIAAAIDRKAAVIEVRDKNGNHFQRQLDFSATEGEIKVENLFQQIGFKPWRPKVEPVVGMVVKDSPAARAGFKVNDRIIAIDKQTVDDWLDVIELVSARAAKHVKVTVLRNQQKFTLEVVPETIERNGKKTGRIGLGHKTAAAYPDDMRVTHGYGMIESLPRAVSRTWDFSVMTLKMVGRIFTGEISIKSLSGPVSIARYAGFSASAGLAKFMDFLAIVSVSLGILNLLPIPVLDGGHLVYYMAEMVRGKAVSDNFQEFAAQVGIILLFSLMAIALYNDLLRVFG